MKIILFVLIQFFVNIVQAITGFGGGPISMPPSIALLGPNDAKAIVTFIMWFSCSFIAIKSIKEVDFKQLGIILGFMIVGVTAGLWLFRILPLRYLMLAYGSIVVSIGVKKFFWENTKPLPRPLRFGALLLAGLMQGMFTSGGPFLALYSTTEITEKRKFRATVSAVWGVLNTYMVFMMFMQGMYNRNNLKIAGYSVIPVIIGVYIGNILNKKMNQSVFMKLVYLLLVISGSLLVFNFFNS